MYLRAHKRGKENIVAAVKWSALVTKALFPEALCPKPTALLSDNKIMDPDCIVSYRPGLYSVHAIQSTNWLHKKEKSVGFLWQHTWSFSDRSDTGHVLITPFYIAL